MRYIEIIKNSKDVNYNETTNAFYGANSRWPDSSLIKENNLSSVTSHHRDKAKGIDRDINCQIVIQ